eukprot:COSAG04_NODE_2791_length_3572_cov_1.879643_6_plen_170_part_01
MLQRTSDNQNHHKQKERKRQKHEKVPAKPRRKSCWDMVEWLCGCGHLSEIACAGLLENVVAEHDQHTQALPTRLTNHSTNPPYQTQHSRLGRARVWWGGVGACLSWCAALGDPLERRRHRLLNVCTSDDIRWRYRYGQHTQQQQERRQSKQHRQDQQQQEKARLKCVGGR